MEQVPGIQRRRFGDIVVTALNDGYIMLPVEAVHGMSAEETDALFRAKGRRPPFATAINAYLVETPDHKVMIDVGCGRFMGPLLGKLPINLRAAGVAPEEIGVIVVSHMHIDHVGGLLTDDDTRRYPNARVLIEARELAYWTNMDNRPGSPPSTQDTFDVVARVMDAYADRIEAFTGLPDIVPGIEAVPLNGHTPGHTGYAIGRDQPELIIWGDVVHAPEIQFRRPEATVIFDVDPAAAAASRRAIIERAVEEDIMIAGMHIPFPGFVRLARANGAYDFHPQVFQYDLQE
nr:MBL fold metallo-hydrolase [Sphingomonas sp. Y57]